MRIDAFQSRGGRQEPHRRVDRNGEAERGEPLRGDDRVWPPSTMLAINGASISCPMRCSSVSLSGSRQTRCRRRPWRKVARAGSPHRDRATSRASVRAMTRKSSLQRESTATSILAPCPRAESRAGTGVWPHFFGNSWSSIWIAVTPARLVAAHGVVHVEQAAEAGVRVGDQRRLDFSHDLGEARKHVAVGGDAGVGDAEVRSGEPEARGIERIEAEAWAIFVDIMSNTPGATTKRPSCKAALNLESAISSLPRLW